MIAPILSCIRDTRLFMRSTASTVLIAFVMLILEPTVAAAQANTPAAQAPATATVTGAQTGPIEADTLNELRDIAGRARQHARRGEDREQAQEETRLLQGAARLDAEEAQAEAEFADIGKHLNSHHLPAEIKQRHSEAVADYRSKMQELKNRIKDFKEARSRKDKAATRQRLDELTAFLDKEQKHRQQQPFDPKNLPFSTPSDKVRAPKETRQELEDLVHPPQAVSLAANELIPGLLAANTPGATPTADDLAETEDVQLTQAIKDQSAALNNNPVEIYNFVRNNIEFLPTYGSIQGSDLTLQTQRGNAFDTASLLIALLRAANIPARYAYGTVQIPIEQVMNWVGGVTNPMAALELLGQGGIPNTGISQGGVIKSVKLEHVWVEAFVDYIPSRGAKHKAGDTWTPLDASFKQYHYSDGMDIKTAVPLDAQSLIDQIKADAIINETEGWVQNLNNAVLQTALTDYQSRVQTYIDSQKPDATVGDVLGVKKIVEQKFPILMGSLPYTVAVPGSQFTQIPDNLRWKIRLNLYASEFDKASQTSQFSVALSLVKIGMRRLSASYAPASEVDAQVIQSYATTNRLPVYLVKEVLKIQIDNTVMVEHHAQTMGAPQYWTYTLTKPGGGAVEEGFKLTSAVGDQIVFGINSAGVSLNQVLTRYHSVDPNSPLENLNHLALGYWARADFSDTIIAKQFKSIAYRLPSVGMFTQPLSVVYSWGIPRFGSYKSYSIDIRRLITTAITIDGKTAANFRFQSGLSASQLEGRIFEEIFDLAPGNGFSAVAVIATAIRNGVPIWKIDANNLQSFLAASILSLEVKSQIANAVSAGLLVITPEEGIDVGFWAGQGYIAVDPKTGAGGYILNSANGGEFAACEEKSQPLPQSINQQILTYAATALAAILIATGEAGSGGLATPAIVIAMRMLSISSLTWSSTSYAAGKCKSDEKCHRGSIQAQGRDIAGPGTRNSRTKSAPWAQVTPLTLTQGLSKLQELKIQLTPAELASRLVYLASAEAYMRTVANAGGVCAGPPKSFGPNGAIKDHVDKGIRVDINVNAGEAFVP